MIRVLSTGTLRASSEEVELLLMALAKWGRPDQFTDAHVRQVKEIFRRAFSLAPGTVLVGSVLPDAIMLQQPGDGNRFYALQTALLPEVSPGADPAGSSWEILDITCTGEETLSWAPGVALSTVLGVLEGTGLLQVVNIGRA